MWNGHPSPITPEVWQRLLAALDAGAPPPLACQYAGLRYETWLAECRRIPEFGIEAEKVSASGVVACLRFVQATGAQEWRAATEFVKLVRPELFGSGRTREAPRVDEPGDDEPDADVTPPTSPPSSVSSALTEAEVARAMAVLKRVARSPYFPARPTARQAALLVAPEAEVLLTGSGGCGKTVGLLMAAFADVDRPGYRALLVQRTLAGPVTLAERAREWLEGTDAAWDSNARVWRFPTGASRVDDLTLFADHEYRRLFQVWRRRQGSRTPDARPRRRVARRPRPRLGARALLHRQPGRGAAAGSPRHRREHGRQPAPRRRGVPALAGQPAPGAPAAAGDRRLVGATGRRDVPAPVVQDRGPGASRAPAGALLGPGGDRRADALGPALYDPDYTVGALPGRAPDGVIYVLDVLRRRLDPQDVKKLVRQTAAMDGREVAIWTAAGRSA